MSSGSAEHICVVGAGIIGIDCGLELLKAGYRVTILTRDDPGTCCSFGAAGNFGGNVHFAVPNLLWKLPRMYLDKWHPFSLYFRDALPLASWFSGYVKAAEPTVAQAIAETLRVLGDGVFESYRDILTEAGDSGLITRSGRLFVWSTQEGFERDRYGLEFRRNQGIELQMLSPDEVRELEPAVSHPIKHGAFAPNSGYILNPLRLVQTLTQHFLRQGGQLVQGELRSVEERPDGVTLRTESGSLQADQAVIAMGIDSKQTAESLGLKVPLIAERGYHAMIETPHLPLKIPVMWEERKILFTAMELGLRVAGIAEFTAKQRPPRPRFAKLLHQTARDFFPQLRTAPMASFWAGFRPVTPDYLPMIGRTRAGGRVICAFGHGHGGYHYGPGTARFVRQIATRQSMPRSVLDRMNPLRFSRP
jgi:D-amino-acid dehydrogenase